MNPTQQTIKRIIAEKAENTAIVDHIALLVKYRDKGKASGDGTVVVAYDDHFGAKKNDCSDNQLLIEKQLLKEILKLDNPALYTCLTPETIIARRLDDPCAGKPESHLRQLDAKKHAHDMHKQQKCAELHHLRNTRPQKPANFDSDPHARKEHCAAMHSHAEKELAAHLEIEQLGCSSQLH